MEKIFNIETLLSCDSYHRDLQYKQYDDKSNNMNA